MAMKLMFARHGVPDVVTSDNGSRFKDFTESREFKHTSNGLMVNQKEKKHAGYKNESQIAVMTSSSLHCWGITIPQWDVF